MGKQSDSRGFLARNALLLMGLLSLMIGVVVLWLGLSSYLESRNMRTWPVVPARIEETSLLRHESNDDGSTTYTYQATARFTYQYEGVTHTGSRVSLLSGSDNIGSFHHDIFNEIENHRASGAPFRAYVNPHNPAESILYPAPRWRLLGFLLIFGLISSGCGSLLIFSHSLAKKKSANLTASRANSADSTGRERREELVIHSSTRGSLLLLFIFAALWTTASLSVIPSALEDFQRGRIFPLWKLIFPAIGVTLLAFILRIFLMWRKFGDSTLTLRSALVQPGGKLDGMIKIQKPLGRHARARLHLRCSRQSTTGWGEHRQTNITTLWSAEWGAEPQPLIGQKGCAIPVSCEIPLDAEPSDRSAGISWVLTATSEVPGIDFTAQYTIPVSPRAVIDGDSPPKGNKRSEIDRARA